MAGDQPPSQGFVAIAPTKECCNGQENPLRRTIRNRPPFMTRKRQRQRWNFTMIAEATRPSLTRLRRPRPPTTEQSARGERGPTLIEDFHFREKIFHFDHERIPERVCACPRLRRARLLRNPTSRLQPTPGGSVSRRPGEEPLPSCGSLTVAGSKGSFDARPRRSRFRGQDLHKRGNWTSSATTSRVLHQDAIKFPDVIHRKARTGPGVSPAQSAP